MNATDRCPREGQCEMLGETLVSGDESSISTPFIEEDPANATGAGQSYYQRSILSILTSVWDVYGNILDEQERSLLTKLSVGLENNRTAATVLSEDAQRLLFRLFLRRAGWLREGRLEYRDIASIRDAVCELYTEGLVERTLQNAEDVMAILQLDELKELARDLGIKATGKAREKLVQEILESRKSKQRRLTFSNQPRRSIADEANEHILKFGSQIVGPVLRLSPCTRTCLDRLIALYFLEATSAASASTANGSNSGPLTPNSLSTAILTDLNRIRYPPYTIIRSRPVFSSRNDWEAYDEALSYERTISEALTGENEVGVEFVETLLATVEERWRKSLPSRSSPTSFNETNSSYFLHRYQAGWIYTRILASFVTILERAKAHERANHLLEMLLHQDSYYRGHRGRWWERLVLNSQTHLGESAEKGLSLLQMALQDPHVRTSSRLNLARRLAKLDPNQSATTGEINPDQIITIYADPEDKRRTGRKLLYLLPGDALGSVEQLAMAHFASKGWIGLHCESRLYRMLFGLLLWDIIFADVPDVFQTPHQVAPLDLGTEAFYVARKEAIERRLHEIGKDVFGDVETNGSRGNIAAQILTDAYYAHYGCQALGMAWEEYPLPVLLNICHSLGGCTLEVILRHLAEDYSGHCCGMPDLLLYKADHSDYLLVEVKSSNDRMSDAQRCWHAIFQEHRIKFILFRVLDTAQEEQETRSNKRLRKSKRP